MQPEESLSKNFPVARVVAGGIIELLRRDISTGFWVEFE